MNYIGKEVRRLDSYEKVTGIARYTTDLRLPRMLHVKLLKSPHAHAKIIKIDKGKAEKLSGVRAVVTGEELSFKPNLFMMGTHSSLSKSAVPYVGIMPIAVKKVRYVGEPVIAVVADTERIAEQALELIEVEYEELPAVFDPRDAIKPNAPLVHENMQDPHLPYIFPVPGTNIANHFKLRKGDVERGFKEADVTVENKFSMPMVQHVQMEPHAVIGQWTSDGQINVWISSQDPFIVRAGLSAVLNHPMNKINVTVPYVGGGFGGKVDTEWAVLTVLLSKKVGWRPVKFVMTREENFTLGAARPRIYTRIKTGVKKDGKIVAMEIEHLWDCGAYADYVWNLARAAGYSSTGPYEVPNLKIDSYVVFTNHPPGCAYRGFGHVEVHWAAERQMDLVAREIGMDPVEFRLKNVVIPGCTTATGEKLGKDAGRADECIKAVAKEIRWGQKSPAEKGKVRGKGIAALWKAPAIPPNTMSSAYLKLNEDGTVTLVLGMVEIGQGTTTALAQMVSDELKIPIEKVKVVRPSTDSAPYSWATNASRSLFMEGNAVLMAIEDFKRKIKYTASRLLDVPEESLDIGGGRVFIKVNPEKGIFLGTISTAGALPCGTGVGGPILGYGYYTAEGLTNLDPKTGQGLPALFWTFGAQGAEVEIDTETGEVHVIRIVTALDLGKAINPMLVKGQIYGGVLMSLGTTFTEEYIFDEKGKLLNCNLTDYKIPRISDIPDVHVPILIENPKMNSPYGARGIGEHPSISVPSAIANAIYEATGVNFYDLPITKEKLWKAIQKGEG